MLYLLFLKLCLAVWIYFQCSCFPRYHHLKLYAENEPGPQSTKKPIVVETYNEIVFPDPPEDFFSRIQNHPSVVVPRLPTTFKLPPGKYLLCFAEIFWILLLE